MIKKLMFLVSAIAALTLPVFAADTYLAPVDPLAWAVVNTDWGPYGSAQVDALRKVVNGQVTAHQASSAYTDLKDRVVKRVKCADAANCVMCSDKARENGQKLRQQISASASTSQGSASMFSAIAAYQKSRADALGEQAAWTAARNKQVITETSLVDGQEVTTTKTVTTTQPGQQSQQALAELSAAAAQQAQQQAQQQGSLVYTYVSAAVNTLQKPAPAVELYVGEDPLR